MSRSARREQQQQTPQMPSGGGQPPKRHAVAVNGGVGYWDWWCYSELLVGSSLL